MLLNYWKRLAIPSKLRRTRCVPARLPWGRTPAPASSCPASSPAGPVHLLQVQSGALHVRGSHAGQHRSITITTAIVTQRLKMAYKYRVWQSWAPACSDTLLQDWHLISEIMGWIKSWENMMETLRRKQSVSRLNITVQLSLNLIHSKSNFCKYIDPLTRPSSTWMEMFGTHATPPIGNLSQPIKKSMPINNSVYMYIYIQLTIF